MVDLYLSISLCISLLVDLAVEVESVWSAAVELEGGHTQEVGERTQTPAPEAVVVRTVTVEETQAVEESLTWGVGAVRAVRAVKVVRAAKSATIKVMMTLVTASRAALSPMSSNH